MKILHNEPSYELSHNIIICCHNSCILFKNMGPKMTWQRAVEDRNDNWGTIERLAMNDRQNWKSYVAALHASGHGG